MTPKEKIDKYIKWYAAMRGQDEIITRWTTQHESIGMNNPTEKDYIAATHIILKRGKESRTLGPCAVLMIFSLTKPIDGKSPKELEECFYKAVAGDASQYPLMEKMMYAVNFGPVPNVKGYMISQFAMGAGSPLFAYFKAPKVALATHWFIFEDGLNYGFGKALSSFTPLELTVHYFQFFITKNPHVKSHQAMEAELTKLGFSKDADIYRELTAAYPKIAHMIISGDPYLSNNDQVLTTLREYPSIALMYDRKAIIYPLWTKCSQILVDCNDQIHQYSKGNLYGASPSLILSTRPEGCKLEELKVAYPDLNMDIAKGDVSYLDPFIPNYKIIIKLDDKGSNSPTSSKKLNEDLNKSTQISTSRKLKLTWNFFDIK